MKGQPQMPRSGIFVVKGHFSCHAESGLNGIAMV